VNGKQARAERRNRDARMVYATLGAVVSVLNRGFWGRLKWLLRGK
jgi:hypothetical protein